MDNKRLYTIGKKFYDNDKHEDLLEDLYIAIDDLLDDLDDKRMEIKLLIEEKESLSSESSEDRMKKLYQELSSIAEEIEASDTSEVEKHEKEMKIFKAKNKYKFMQLETAEQKYADAVRKGSSNIDLMQENLKKLKLNTLNLQKKLERFQEKVNEAKGPLLKLEAKRELILKNISEAQQAGHKNNNDSIEKLNNITQVLKQKKVELDNIKNSIKRAFIKIGHQAVTENLK